MENRSYKFLWIVVLSIFLAGVLYIYKFTGTEISKIPVVISKVEDGISADEEMVEGKMSTNFEKVGYIVVNNPGYIPNKIFFLYEEQGKPALTAEIATTSESVCRGFTSCELFFDSPSIKDVKTKAVGFLSDGILYISTLGIVENKGSVQ